MKTKKLNLENLKDVLSRDEMRKIMAGSGNDCEEEGSSCNSGSHINCCSGLVCASFVCQKRT